MMQVDANSLSNVRTREPEEILRNKFKKFGLIGRSAKFIKLLKTIEAVSRCDIRVMLEGETGTGKELVAHAIHELSDRHDFPFIAIDSGAIPENLIESELFGYTKGTFTGASCDRKGLFEEANNGTLFLDEISNLPLSLQVKLLRVLQDGVIRVLGSNQEKKVDVRIISAASSSLKDKVLKHEFREDLYFRLNAFPIALPTLEERRDDIPLLATYFTKQFAIQQQKKARSLSISLHQYLQNMNWFGNIRQLENYVEMIVTLVPQDAVIIDYPDLPEDFLATTSMQDLSVPAGLSDHSLFDNTNAYQKDMIMKALKRNRWNQSKTAQELKISERTIRYKIQKYGIKPPSK
jgi:transcriptional regulator with PAS, ATPase and Fis domain